MDELKLQTDPGPDLPDVGTERLSLGPDVLQSRLLMGSSRYPNPHVMLEALRASGTEMVTVSIRRVNVYDKSDSSTLALLRQEGFKLLPNTAGCYTAKEAILVAELAREALETDRIKLEVIGNDDTLLPDVEQTLKAARHLVKDGFHVYAYTNDDPVVAARLAEAGCVAVMPLASPIGSGMGLLNPYNLRLVREAVADTAVVVDAGIGTASDACLAMEIGVDAVLMNTAVSQAQDPIGMATAMRLAIESGRAARLSGRIPRQYHANPSSPMKGRVGS